MFDTDLDAFFDMDPTAALIDGEAITGLFDNGFAAIDVGSEVIEGIFYQLTVKSTDLAGLVAQVVHDTAVTVNGSSFTISGIQPDGQGLTKLILTEV